MTRGHAGGRACSLPMWFPPVTHRRRHATSTPCSTPPANLEEAIRRGADELWIIWTTSRRGEWRNGFVGNFFGIFEATTNGGYKRDAGAHRAQQRGRRARARRASSAGHIAVRELAAEVPLHYLFNFSRKRIAKAVDLGVEAARAWCARNRAAHPEPPSADLDRTCRSRQPGDAEERSGRRRRSAGRQLGAPRRGVRGHHRALPGAVVVRGSSSRNPNCSTENPEAARRRRSGRRRRSAGRCLRRRRCCRR